jgi:hypothetical protein
MKNGDGPDWLVRIQNTFLPLAKGIYIVAALGSLLTVIGGAAFILYLQSVIARPPKTVPIPPPYADSAAQSGGATAQEMDFALVDKRLVPPENVRFNVTIGTITAPLRQEDNVVLGYFTADTKNGLDRVDLQGRDAALFEAIFSRQRQQIGLKPTSALVNEIVETLRDIQEEKERRFEIEVIARDQYKNRPPEPTTISFSLRFAPKSPPSAAPEAPWPEVAEPEPSGSESTELEKIAGDIAKAVVSEVSPERAAAFSQALKTPEECGANKQNEAFVANYRKAFELVRDRINADNVKAFYTGMCEAWKNVLQREAAARRQAEEERAAARRGAEEARVQAVAFNNAALARHQAESLAARATSYLTMSVVGGALAAFLSISLIVAFLAIEGHSRAIRQAVEAMVKVSENTSQK